MIEVDVIPETKREKKVKVIKCPFERPSVFSPKLFKELQRGLITKDEYNAELKRKQDEYDNWIKFLLTPICKRQ